MKKILFTLFVIVTLSACGSAYNTQLKQIELGMTKEQVTTLMGDKYTEAGRGSMGDETIEYKDRYKNHWFFEFTDNQLVKWYKETEK
ncbi:MAG: hypothetical protein ACLVKO_11340 [Dysgonomonas sp.]